MSGNCDAISQGAIKSWSLRMLVQVMLRLVSVMRFLFTVVFYVSMDCVVLQCFEQSPYNLIPYVSIYPDISNVESSHTPHAQRQNTSDQTFRVKPCNWQWPSTARGNLSRLVDGGGAEAGGRCACQGAPTDEHVGRVKSSQHLTIFGMNWYIFFSIGQTNGKQPKPNSSSAFSGHCKRRISYCVDPTPSWVAHDSASAFQRPQVVAAAQVATGSSTHDAELNWVLWGESSN